MDELTRKYYAAHAPEVADRYDNAISGVVKYFPLAFARGMRVLDIGAGSGRDMAALRDMGCDVYGVEPCEELRRHALERYVFLRGKLEPPALPNLGQPFGGHFDGVLLWHNNDLWNLLPVLPVLNQKKRDQLPTRDLLLRRKDWIINYWNVLRSVHLHRFDHEAARIIGKEQRPGSWQNLVFQSVAEVVEVTAIQRGCERWQP
jgi:SAM-dependent methyltransferase